MPTIEGEVDVPVDQVLQAQVVQRTVEIPAHRQSEQGMPLQ